MKSNDLLGVQKNKMRLCCPWCAAKSSLQHQATDTTTTAAPLWFTSLPGIFLQDFLQADVTWYCQIGLIFTTFGILCTSQGLPIAHICKPLRQHYAKGKIVSAKCSHATIMVGVKRPEKFYLIALTFFYNSEQKKPTLLHP